MVSGRGCGRGTLLSTFLGALNKTPGQMRALGAAFTTLLLACANAEPAEPSAISLAGLSLNHAPLDVPHGAFVSADAAPLLSWHLECRSAVHDCRGERQATYRASVHRHGDADDSTVASVSGGADSAVELAAPGALRPDSRYRVALEVTTASGAALSATAYFHTALLPPDWTASTWIGGFTSLRSEFSLTKSAADITSATLYASAVGCFQASLNGVPVSDSVLDPGFSTDYTKRILYRAFDVLKSLREKNALGVRLGFCKYGCKSKMSVL